MHRGFLRTGCLLTALAVVLGAFGAHALKKQLTADMLAVFETGVRYHFYHAFGLVLTGILYREFNNGWIRTAAYLFIAGVIFFCGSLYLLGLRDYFGISGYRWLGPITPLGGICFIGGWIALIAGTVYKKHARLS